MSPTMDENGPAVHERSLVTAPAGSGKTVQLVRRYLHELRLGATPSQIVAITFTRKAAAELVERIGGVLHAAAGWEPDVDALYAPWAPPPAVAREALAALPNAPVSTVDSFVFDLVGELLLDARYVAGEQSFWIDGPLQPATSTPAFEAAAREVLEACGPDGELSPEVLCLLAEDTLGGALKVVASLAALDDGDVVRRDGRLLGNRDLLGAVRTSSVQVLADTPPPVAADVEPAASAKGKRAAAREAARVDLAALLEGSDFALLVGLVGSKAPPEAPAVLDAVSAAVGVRVTPEHLAASMKETAHWDAAACVRADAVREAAWALSRRARAIALRAFARRGESTHAELLRAATDLCHRARDAAPGTPLAGLRDRYAALLVDEVQDTSPDQLAFYEALLGMRPGIRRFFVGDARQSIYRFRGADLHGWQDLIASTRESDQGTLTVNYRSTAALVAAQRATFANLAALGVRGVDGLDAVEARPGAADGLLPHEALPQPIVVVASPPKDKPFFPTLDAFALRLGRHWQREELLRAHGGTLLPPGAEVSQGGRSVTAGVLLPSWTHSGAAAQHLARYGIAARVVGDRSLLRGAVARDVRVLLRSLLDPSDEIAWLGVLKHPAIGLRDGSLPPLRPFAKLLAPGDGGVFPNPAWLHGLDTDESRALSRALPVLRDARSRIGREPTAALLDEVWTRLGWRPLVAAGPDGDHGLAQLDLIADLVRAAEASAVDPFGVLDALAPGEEGEADLPKVRLAGEGPIVEVTTIFSAKGLEYDHVALPQDVFDAVRRRDRNLVDHLRVAGKGVLAVHVDPRGALKPRKDPWTLWVGACDAAERSEEQWRLLYVGLTRARQSVTLGLGATAKGTSAGDQQRLALGVDALKHPPDEPLRPVEGLLAVRPDQEVSVLPAPPPHVPVRARTARAFEPLGAWEPSVGRRLRSPSRWAEGQQDGGALVRAMRQSARIEVADGAPELPFPEGLPERRRGDVVHSFLEHWAFRGDPDPDACARFLGERWRHDDPALAAALCALGRHLLAALPGFRSLIEGATLHFEAPVVAAVSTPDAPGGEDILLGRVDLLVEHPDGAVSVLDFKAGSHFAQVSVDGADIPGLAAYAWQLHGYREALVVAGRRVRSLGLVYVRRPSMVLWD